MSPGVTEVDETGASPANMGGFIDEAEMDRAEPVRQREHPFGTFCDRVRNELGLPGSQSSREVVSAVVNACARLTVVEKTEVKEQAAHIGKLIAKDREDQGDPMLWVGQATKIAEHVLDLRIKGEAPIANSAQEEE